MEMNAMLVEQVTKFFRSVLRPRRKIKICSDRKKGNYYSYGLGSAKNYTGIFFPPVYLNRWYCLAEITQFLVPYCSSHTRWCNILWLCIHNKERIQAWCWRWFLYRKIFVCVIHPELIFFIFFFSLDPMRYAWIEIYKIYFSCILYWYFHSFIKN